MSEGARNQESHTDEETEGELILDLFPPDKAEANFEKLAKKFYDRNFGTFPKAEIDLMMFEFAYEEMKERSVLDIAMRLGITPNRVESYLEKMDLRGKDLGEVNWWEIVKSTLTGSKAHCEHGKIYYVLPSRFSKHRLSEALDKGGYFHDYSFHSRALVVPASAFLSVVMDVYFREKKMVYRNMTLEEFEDAFRGDFELKTDDWNQVLEEIKEIHDCLLDEEEYRRACRKAGNNLSSVAGMVGVFGKFLGHSFG